MIKQTLNFKVILFILLGVSKRALDHPKYSRPAENEHSRPIFLSPYAFPSKRITVT